MITKESLSRMSFLQLIPEVLDAMASCNLKFHRKLSHLQTQSSFPYFKAYGAWSGGIFLPLLDGAKSRESYHRIASESYRSDSNH